MDEIIFRQLMYVLKANERVPMDSNTRMSSHISAASHPVIAPLDLPYPARSPASVKGGRAHQNATGFLTDIGAEKTKHPLAGAAPELFPPALIRHRFQLDTE